MDFNQLLLESKNIQQNVIANNTRKNYQFLLKRYRSLSLTIPGFPKPFPITEDKMRVFLEYYRCKNPKTTYGYLKLFISAFSYNFRSNNLPLLTQNPSFLEYVKGLQRTVLSNKVPNAKAPITKEIMHSLSHLIDLGKVKDIQGMLISSLCFYGFLRISECLRLRVENINIDVNDRMIITIDFSKTNQNGCNEKLYIYRTQTRYSPFIWYPIYLENVKPTLYLFNFTQNKFRRFLKKKLKYIIQKEELEKYSSHSFRKGAAYSAALAGVQDCQIKKWEDGNQIVTRYIHRQLKKKQEKW